MPVTAIGEGRLACWSETRGWTVYSDNVEDEVWDWDRHEEEREKGATAQGKGESNGKGPPPGFANWQGMPERRHLIGARETQSERERKSEQATASSPKTP